MLGCKARLSWEVERSGAQDDRDDREEKIGPGVGGREEGEPAGKDQGSRIEGRGTRIGDVQERSSERGELER